MALFEGFSLYGEDIILWLLGCCWAIFLILQVRRRGKFDVLRQQMTSQGTPGVALRGGFSLCTMPARYGGNYESGAFPCSRYRQDTAAAMRVELPPAHDIGKILQQLREWSFPLCTMSARYGGN